MRDFRDEEGNVWRALALDGIVAHGKRGAILAYQPAFDEAAGPLRTPVSFNSMDAAAFAIRTMSDKELRRRLGLARASAGGV